MTLKLYLDQTKKENILRNPSVVRTVLNITKWEDQLTMAELVGAVTKITKGFLEINSISIGK
jgi:hypothetical protein